MLSNASPILSTATSPAGVQSATLCRLPRNLAGSLATHSATHGARARQSNPAARAKHMWQHVHHTPSVHTIAARRCRGSYSHQRKHQPPRRQEQPNCTGSDKVNSYRAHPSFRPAAPALTMAAGWKLAPCKARTFNKRQRASTAALRFGGQSSPPAIPRKHASRQHL